MRIPLDLAGTRLITSDGITASLCKDSKRFEGQSALRLDVSFGGSGHATVRIPVSIELPENYKLSFSVCGVLPENTLEVKFVDPSQDFVWWVNRPHFSFSSKWQTLASKRRHFSYAWGPNREPLSTIAFIELTVTASSGGKGSVFFAGLDFEEIPLDQEYTGKPTATTSTNQKDAAKVLDGSQKSNGLSSWRSSTAEKQICTLDFGQMREFGGLIVDWDDDYAREYDVQIKKNNGRWQTVDTVSGGKPGRQFHYLPESDARAVRLKLLHSSHGRGYAIKHVKVMPISFASSLNEFLRHVSADGPVGHYPRYMQRLQSFWTVVGVSGGANEAIINEEGMVEIGRQTPSIEPFIYVDDQLLSWNEGSHEQSLEDGHLPVASVLRKHDTLSLKVTALADGEQKNSCLYVRYLITNDADVAVAGKLLLALRPLQVNPPWQFLNIPGGHSAVHNIFGNTSGVSLNNDQVQVKSLTEASAFGATSLTAGDIVSHMAQGKLPAAQAIEDIHGLGSAALSYDFALAPGQSRIVDIAVPWFENAEAKIEISSFDDAHANTLAYWRSKLEAVQIKIPAAQDIINTMKAQVAYILINRDGKAIQPGSRCYRRTWIRDGSLTSTALLQNGCIDEVRDFITWFSPFQYPSGKVPCCVDKRGSDPTPEHDSHGEYIYLVAEYYRYTGDIELLRQLFPRILTATQYIDALRQQRRTPEYMTADKRHLFGLLPESISHEGYSAKPMHSYWDDIFAHKGLCDAVFIAEELGATRELDGLKALRDQFHTDFVSSIKLTMQHHAISYIPGCADLGDFDATSTTIGLDPDDVLLELPEAVKATFDKYWEFFVARRDGTRDWYDYTPYEWRNVGALLRLGEAEKAHAALEFFMSHRRPAGWKHWCEVVYKNPLNPGFIGDAPHGWVASDYLRSIRGLLAYEANDRLVVGAGIKPEWFEQGVSFKNLKTHHGEISMTARNAGNNLVLYGLEGKLTKPVFLIFPKHVKVAWLDFTPTPCVETSHGWGVLIETLPKLVMRIR